MDTLRIDTGIKTIAILDKNNNQTGVISFNPSDLIFAEKFYQLVGEFETKQTEYLKRYEEIDSNSEKDSNNIPVNLPNKLSLLREICEYIRGRIDHLFGAGTSLIVFGDALTLDAFSQFFEGITPYVQTARTEKVSKYQRHNTSKVMK